MKTKTLMHMRRRARHTFGFGLLKSYLTFGYLTFSNRRKKIHSTPNGHWPVVSGYSMIMTIYSTVYVLYLDIELHESCAVPGYCLNATIRDHLTASHAQLPAGIGSVYCTECTLYNNGSVMSSLFW